MLILTRKADQGIVIQGDIMIRVLAIEGDRVKLGITAPRSIGVLREELCEAVRDENREALASRAVGGPDTLADLQKQLRPVRRSGSGGG